MRKADALIGVFVLWVCVCVAAAGQRLPSTDIGFVPNGMYSHSEIDSVNMENGNAVIHIPLFGLPQRGGSLTLNYKIFANTNLWLEDYYCFGSSDYQNCTHSFYRDGTTPPNNSEYEARPCGRGLGANPTVSTDGDGVGNWCIEEVHGYYCTTQPGLGSQPILGSCVLSVANTFYVAEQTGERHRLEFDANDLTTLRTADGSGYVLRIGDPQAYMPYSSTDCTNGNCSYVRKSFPNATLLNKHGATSATDRNHNQITYSLPDLVDTVGRVIPPVPVEASTTSTVGCPDVGGPYQVPTGSADWSIPGPNGATAVYKFCFTEITYRTNFWGYGPGGHYETQSTSDGTLDGEGTKLTWFDEGVGQESVLQSIVLPDHKMYWGFVYDAADPSDSTSIGYGTIAKITSPLGGAVSYQYGQTNGCDDGSGYAAPILYIAQRNVSDAMGHTYQWSYSYNDTRIIAGSSLESRMRDPEGNDTIFGFKNPINSGCQYQPLKTIHYGGAYSNNKVLLTEEMTNQATYSLGVPYSNAGGSLLSAAPLLRTETDNAGNIKKTQFGYDSGFSYALPACTTATGVYDCGIRGTATIPFDFEVSRTQYNYDGTVNASTSTSYKWQTDSNYYNANLLDLPDTITISDASGTTLSLEQYGYDPDLHGNLTSITQAVLPGSATITTNIGYDYYGMPITMTDSRSNTTTTTYDANGLFPSSVQRPTTNVPHTEYYQYDTNTGNLLWHTDENGIRSGDPAHTTTYSYSDPFGRLTKSLGPLANGAQSESDVSYNDTARSVTTKVILSPSLSVSTSKVYDGIGRTIQTVASNSATSETSYNYHGNVISVSNPHLPAASGLNGYITYAYDPLGRIAFKCNQDSVSVSGTCTASATSLQQWSYSGNVVTFTDEINHSWQRTSDALGKLTHVVEPHGASTYYSYDPLGNLTCAVQDAGSGAAFTSCLSTPATWRPRSFSYDSLSRLITASNPETGTIQYSYTNAVGALCAGDVSLPCSKTDARGILTNYAYDALNRLNSKTYSYQSGAGSTIQALAIGTPSNCYLYDTAVNGIGRLGAEWTQAGSCSPALPSNAQSQRLFGAYDAMGRVVSEQQCVAGYCTSASLPAAPSSNCTVVDATLGLQYCYDLAGDLLAYASGVTPAAASSYPQAALSFSHTFDSAGRLATINSSWLDLTHPQQLFGATSTDAYTAANGLENWSLGGSLWTARAYDVRNRVCQQKSAFQVIPTVIPCP